MNKILFFSGFAQNPNIVENLLYSKHDHLNYIPYQFSDLTSLIKKKYDCFIGWSLGGQIALKLANLLHIKKLILISTPYQFVNDENFKFGILQKDFNSFSLELKTRPNPLDKFNSLINYGDKHYKQISSHLITTNYKKENLIYWLNFLNNYRGKNETNYPGKTLLIYGKKDILVNYNQGEILNTKIQNSTLYLFPESGHAPFLHDKQQFNHIVETFLS